MAIDKKRLSSSLVPELVTTHLHLPYAYPALKAKLEESSRAVLSSYIQKNQKLFDKLEFSEKKIELSLGEGVSVAGRIDLVRRLDTGEISIVDLKTSERSQAEAVTETQLHIYAMGYEQLTGSRADYVEIYELEEGRRKSRAVDSALLKSVTKNVLRAATALRESDLPPAPSLQNCQSCDYSRMCSAGQTHLPQKRAGTGKKAGKPVERVD